MKQIVMTLRPISTFIFGIVILIFSSCVPDHEQSEDQNTSPPIKQSGATTKGFDEMSSEYYASGARVIWQRPELVLNLLGDLNNRTVADIGAGTGYFTFRLAAAGATVIGIDIDPRAISFINTEKERYPTDIQERFSTRLAKPGTAMLDSGEVDVVLMVNTYIYLKERVRYLVDLKTGFKPNGQIVIIDFKKKETTIGPIVEDRLSAIQVQKELTEAGYTVLNTDESTLDFQYLIRALRPQH